jgi:hypothetical protein
MASVVGICNRALQKLGARRITSLTEDTPSARACNVAYEAVRDAELRAHPWSFAIQRFSLAASSTEPLFNKTSAFPLPSGFLRLIDPDPEVVSLDADWQIEGNEIITNYDAPLEVRCLVVVTDPNVMDPLFREALATKLALELCEEITQSNSKKAELKDDYRQIIRDARRVNAFERISQVPPEDPWVTCRS